MTNFLPNMRSFFILSVLMLIALPLNASAHGEAQNTPEDISLDETVETLLDTHNAESVTEINCDEVSEHDFEDLGEALMGYMHPDEEEHARIDEFMGGEGSSQLESMHVFMGKRYLGCDEGAYGPMMMHAGQGNWIGWNDGTRSGMMMGGALPFTRSGPGSGFFWAGVFQVVIWVLAFIGLVALVKSLLGKKGASKKAKRQENSIDEDASNADGASDDE